MAVSEVHWKWTASSNNTCENKQIDKAENCPDIELNSRSLEIMEKFCHLIDTIGARGCTGGSVITSIRIGWFVG